MSHDEGFGNVNDGSSNSRALLCTSPIASIVGSKASCLLQLQSIVPVPALACLPGNVYLEHISSLPEYENFIQRAPNHLDESLSRMQQAIEHAPLSHDVSIAIMEFGNSLNGCSLAVRSSCLELEDATDKSFAGQFGTKINVYVSCLPEAVKFVWASLWTKSVWFALDHIAVLEQRARRMSALAMGVILQELVASESCGIAFTRSPVSSQPQCMLVEACWGQGMAIADGTAVPDRWVIDRASGRIAFKEIVNKATKMELLATGGLVVKENDTLANKASLSDGEIANLVVTLQDIESFYGTPQDVEFALDARRQLFILQARPITAVEPASDRPEFPFGQPFEAVGEYQYRQVLHHGPDTHVFAHLITSINQGFHDASQEYGATTVGQLSSINDYIYSFKKPTGICHIQHCSASSLTFCPNLLWSLGDIRS